MTKNKKWREVSTSLNLGASSSAGFTLKRNYAKFLFPFECRYDRGNIDPAPIIASMEMSSKKDSKKNMDRTAVDIGMCVVQLILIHLFRCKDLLLHISIISN